jgi:hypothetical protein
MTQFEGFAVIMAAVIIGGAIRILIFETKLDKWVRRYWNYRFK